MNLLQHKSIPMREQDLICFTPESIVRPLASFHFPNINGHSVLVLFCKKFFCDNACHLSART